MKITPGKWTILCRSCSGDVFLTLRDGWLHEGNEIPDHKVDPVAVDCNVVLKSMGINIVPPGVSSAIDQAAAMLNDLDIPGDPGMIHVPA